MPHRSYRFLGKKIYKRDDAILSFVRGKRIVHFGCVDDDAIVIARKSGIDDYLHKKVTDAALLATGVDMNRDMFPELKQRFGIDNIVYGNIEDPSTFECDAEVLKQAEVLLIADVIEHLNNPGRMLEGIAKTFSPDITVCITTPNPFNAMNMLNTLRNREGYSDWHTCYFSAANMEVLAKRCGFTIAQVLPYMRSSNSKSSIKRALSKIVLGFFTLFSKGFCDGFLYVLRRHSS